MPIKPEKQSEIRRLHVEERISCKQIAKILHIDPKAVLDFAREEGIYSDVRKAIPVASKICKGCPEKGLQNVSEFTKRGDGIHVAKCRACHAKTAIKKAHMLNPDKPYKVIIDDEKVLLAINEGAKTIKELTEKTGYSYNHLFNSLMRLDRFEQFRQKPTGNREKFTFNEHIAKEIMELFEQSKGTRYIAKELSISRVAVYSYYEIMGIDNSSIKSQIKPIPTNKTCKDCPEKGQQPIANFRSHKSKKKGITYISYEAICLGCERKRKNKASRIRGKERRQNDPCFKIRHNVSRSICRHFELSGLDKGGESCLDHLPFTIEGLKIHIEDHFMHEDNLVLGKSWMTWENHGIYRANEWDDNDPSTWVWHLDHITPHSKFEYTSMDCEEFRQCWALSNLRPYAAKPNVIEGARRTRH